MNFNISKCKVLAVTKRPDPVVFPYRIEGALLDRVESISNLGILLDDLLKWNSHVTKMVSKEYTTLWLIKRSVGYNTLVLM